MYFEMEKAKVLLLLLYYTKLCILSELFLSHQFSTFAEKIDWIEETAIDLDFPPEADNSTIKDHDAVVACRVHEYARRRNPRAKYDIFDENGAFDGNLCTHLVYGPFIVNDTFQIENSDSFKDLSGLSNNISSRFPHLKILLEVTLEKNETEIFKITQLGVKFQENHLKFIENMKTIIKQLKLHGIFLEKSFHLSVQRATAFDKYVTSKGTSTEEILGHYLADEFHNEGLIVAAEIGLYHKLFLQSAHKELQTYITQLSFGRVVEMSRLYDFVVVNGYKTMYREKSFSNYNSPLYHWEKRDFNIYDRLKTTILEWKASPGKLVLAVPFFGYPYLLYDSSSFGYKAPTDPNGFSGPLLNQKSLWGYNEVCYTTILNKNSWKMYWDTIAKVPFMKKGNHWLTFDNSRSIKEKVILAMGFGLKGIMADSVDTDDTFGRCSHTINPLLKTINYALQIAKSETLPLICNSSHTEAENSSFKLSPTTLTDFFVKRVDLNQTIQVNCSAEGYPAPDIRLINEKNETVGSINYTEHSLTTPCTIIKRRVTLIHINSSNTGKYSCVANNSKGVDQRDLFLMNEKQPFLLRDKEIWIRKMDLDFTIPKINSTLIGEDQILFCKVNVNSPKSEVQSKHYDILENVYPFDEKICDFVIYGTFPVNSKYEIEEKIIGELDAIKNLTTTYPALKVLLEISVDPFHNLGDPLSVSKASLDFKDLIMRYGFSGVHFDSSIYLDSSEKSFNRDRNFAAISYSILKIFHKEGLLVTTEIELYSEKVLNHIHEELLYKMSSTFDFVFLKLYDFTKSHAPNMTGHNAPLHSVENSNENIEKNLQHLLKGERVKSYSSLVFGMPFYGYHYILKDPNSFGFGFNASSSILKRKTPFNQICSAATKNADNWEMFWDNKARVPFLKNGRHWITLETPKSIYEKFQFYSTLLNKFKFRGIMVDSIDKDDYLGGCNNTDYPLLRTVHTALRYQTELAKNPEIAISKFSEWWWIALIAALILLSLTIAGSQFVIYKINQKSSGLTQKEIAIFIAGCDDNVEAESEIEKNPDRLPYNASYEVPKANYQIDTCKILGMGAFGIVYQGSVGEITVAAKSVKPEAADIQYLKSILSELKILIYLEKHPNIVNLIGADTSELKKGKVFVFVEFCQFGCLQDYLRGSRDNFRSTFHKNTTYNNWQPEEGDIEANVLSSEHLIIWCLQIAKALEHLDKKKIIHGDLAARNVLVFHKHLVKITDFGLSRKLYNYSEYVKKNQEPLPWRWMAIESLRDLTFSIQSDIWSFGITMWEIFSLAETPYPGLSWSSDFVQLLKDDLRMQRPVHATNELYSFMLECWRVNPKNRPKPEDVTNFFSNFIKSNAFKRYSVFLKPEAENEEMHGVRSPQDRYVQNFNSESAYSNWTP